LLNAKTPNDGFIEHCQAIIGLAAPPLPPEFNDKNRSVITPQGETTLTRSEWELLMILYTRSEHLLSYDHLLGMMYGHRPDPPDCEILKGLRLLAAAGTQWARLVPPAFSSQLRD
jgi:hypothetical protein